MRRALILLALLSLTACAAPSVTVKPCGVITDSLKDVRGKTRDDDRRISINYERGFQAGCWK